MPRAQRTAYGLLASDWYAATVADVAERARKAVRDDPAGHDGQHHASHPLDADDYLGGYRAQVRREALNGD